MTDFDPFMRAVDHEADVIRRREANEERAKLEDEQARLDRDHNTEIAKRKAIAQRKATLDIAWAAAELINQTDALPTYLGKYIRKPKSLFRRKPLEGISAEGWSLLAWRSTEHNRGTTHRLILTPRGQGPAGVHLSFIDEQTWAFRDDSPLEVSPENVHPLPLEPLSDDDMPWPLSWEGEKDESGVLVNDEIDHRLKLIESMAEMAAEFYRETDKTLQLTPFPRAASEYGRYARKGPEVEIRRALAATVALHLRIAPEKAAATIKRRLALGIE